MGFVFDADALIAALEARGYGAEREDETLVTGRLERAAVRQVWVDGGGRVRLQVTRMADEPTPEIVVQNEREYRVSRETHHVTNVYVSLDDAARLGEVLDDIDRLARGAPPPEPAPEPPTMMGAPTPYEAATAEEDRPAEAPSAPTPPTPPEAPAREEDRPAEVPSAPTPPMPPEAPVGADIRPTDLTTDEPEAPDPPSAPSTPPEANDDSPLTQLKRFWRRLI